MSRHHAGHEHDHRSAPPQPRPEPLIYQGLKGVRYSIDYYQREYKWGDKQVREMVDDLTNSFLDGYDPSHERRQVVEYPHYFLGSIIISKKDANSYVV
jgi:uncharacterized protein with ParB-like and HNH nuclease domain